MGESVKKIITNNFLQDKSLCVKVIDSKGIVVSLVAQSTHFPGSHHMSSQNYGAQSHRVTQRATLLLHSEMHCCSCRQHWSQSRRDFTSSRAYCFCLPGLHWISQYQCEVPGLCFIFWEVFLSSGWLTPDPEHCWRKCLSLPRPCLCLLLMTICTMVPEACWGSGSTPRLLLALGNRGMFTTCLPELGDSS